MVLDPDLDVRPSVQDDNNTSIYNTVGVFVDAPAGVLSFYRLSFGSLLHLHTFSAAFRLLPHSSVCLRSTLGDVTR